MKRICTTLVLLLILNLAFSQTTYYVNDNSIANDVFTSNIGSDTNPGTAALPFATIQHAADVAVEGSIIYVDAGVYFEQVTLTKGLSLFGVNSGVTIVWKPAVTNPPPGPFTEQGTIQSAQNIGDVHIRDMSISGDPSIGITPIILQTGGSVKNCRLIGGSQGIFFRVDPAVKTAIIENNYINVDYIGVNCQGSGLTVMLINNTIDMLNPGFAAGVFAGLDFGPLVKFTAIGNSINNYNAQGFLANSYNTTITQNSILGTGQHAIEQSSNSLGIATCNWYGTTDAVTIASKVSGLISYTPFLTNGTNTNTTYGNYSFIPVAGSCGEGGNSFYVNDNNITGDVFTTAVGNNANSGTPAAPLATITEALARVVAGDIIYVDAGNYSEQVDITKNITIHGAGMGVTILNGPAHVVPLPGTGETGIIQTVQGLNNVIIESMTIDGTIADEQHGIFIQGGGRVSNCELRYVNDGFYFSSISAQSRTAIGNSNYVHHISYVGSLFAGNGLTATASNNVIDLNGANYGMGFIAGYGGDGNLASFTATNNSIINFNGFGMMIGSLQTAQVHNNSITRITGNFLQNVHSVNVNATCNWYGTTDAGVIIPNMSGNVSYTPWLTNGTDNSNAIGFQSLQGICIGRQNKFYVNDNSLTGDVFSTGVNPVGNDANPGIPSAPLLTIGAALTKASAGDTIFVDAGTYAMANLTINKSITILGSNYLISPNNASNKTLYNTGRNAESRITGGTLVMGADWIIVNGMRISSNTAISMSGNFSHIKMDKNYFDMATTASTVSLSGSSLSPITALDYAITDNRFERQDASSGDGVFISAVSSSWIDNNTFIELNASPFRGFALRTAGNADVSNVIFTNNYVKKLQVGVLPFRVQTLLVSNNMFDSCSAGYNQTPQGAVSNNITISSNIFNNIRVARNILVRGGTNGGVNNLNIQDNTINQAVDGINGIVGMIQLDYAVANVSGTTTVSGNKINISGNYANTNVGNNCGIMIVGEHTNTTISNNELTFTAINASLPLVPALPPVPTGIFINTDPGAQSGLIPSNAIINITNNKINGFKSSIGFYDPSASNITPNIGYGYLTAGTQVNIHDNSFTNDSISIDNGAISQNINATCNFYNTNVPEVLITKISPETGDYLPWLVNGTDNEPLTTGFQPVPGSCTGRVNKLYVNDAITAGDVFTTKAGDDVLGYGLSTSPFATITKALTEAQAGDSIFVDAGTYVLSADLTIGKAITILGTNYLLSPNDANDKRVLNTVRNTESIVSNATLIIGSNDISIQGAVLDPGPAAIAVFFSNSNYNNISLIKNRIKMNSTSPSIRFEGQGTSTIAVSALVNSGFTINDNRFEKYDAGNSNAINISRLKNVIVTNNAFVVGGSTLRNYTAIAMGNVGVIDAITFSTNTIDRASAAITGGRIGNAVMNGNKIYNTTNAFNISNTIPESSIVEFSNNLLDGSAGVSPFSFYTRGGGNAIGATNLFKAENNTAIGVGVPGTTTLLGTLNATFTNTVLSPSLVIRGNKISYSGDLSSVEGQFIRPIVIRGKLSNAIVENNELTLGGTNLRPRNPANVLPVCPAISLYSDNGSNSVIPAGAVINILNNKIQGFKYSFIVFDPTNAAGTGDPFTGFGNLGPNIAVNVHENSFTADSMSINNGSVGYPIDASCNWYGSSAVQNLVGKFSTDLDNIYVPYLSNGTDNDPATGFQPVPGSCNGQPLQARLDGFTNATCNGANNGTASVTVFNGVAPFVFAWTKDGDPSFSSSVEDPTNFGAGTYHLSITDALGTNIILDANTDITTIDVTITEPPALTASPGGSNVSCFGGSNGTASVTAGGGTPDYTYSWSNGATTSSISNLAAGTYTVTVTDKNGCTKQASYEVTQPASLTANGTGTNVSCFGGSNGTASVTVGGGTLPYTYLWSNGSTNASISNVATGIYTVTVTDGNGCTKSSSYEVTQPALLVVNLTGTSASCNGSATATVSGGTLPYTYLWSNGATTASINNVPAGLYSVTVTDAHNCIASGSYTITGSSPINPITSLVHVSCFGGSNGSITITGTSSGTAPFTYNLNGSSFQTSNTFNNLAAGVYVVGIKDANGCSDFVSRTLNQPAALTVVLDSLRKTCGGANTGRIYITVSGGSGGKIYNWTGPNGFTSTVQDPNNIAAGNYSVLVTDANGCSANLNVTLPEYPVINVSADITNVLCFGAATGSIDITVTGGSGSGFTYLWNNGATTQDRFNLAVGNNYRITVTDIGSGCSVSRRDTVRGPVSVVTVTVPNPNIINVTGCNSLGSFTAQGSGGTQYPAPDPYRYSINGLNYQTSPVFKNLPAGSYTVTIKDVNGCIATKAVNITDNGSDEYEGAPNNIGNNNNNAKAKAAPISPGTAISARIGIAGDLDYYKLGTANLWTGNYTIAFVQPAIAVTFDLLASNGTTIIAPTSSSATYKQYNGLNGTYYVRVSGTNSLGCYQFTVSSGILTRSSGSNIQPEVTKAKDRLFDVKVLGNPTSTSFIMNVITSSDEKISMRIFDAQGRLIEERQGLQPMETLRVGERYINGMYMAEIRQGKNLKTIRLVKM